MPESEFTIKLPVVMVPGEPGDPLTTLLQNVINAIAEFGYWPLDFGESDDQWCELTFVYESEQGQAKRQAKHFIEAGGNV